MAKGFFEASSTQSKFPLNTLIPKCGACGLYKGCESPKMPISGDGEKGILVIAEAPGEEEDKKGEQLIGKAGQTLRKALRKFGVDLDRDCWKTNSLICRPPKNRTPKSDEIDYCRPNLLQALKDYNPRVIIPLGGPAVRSLIGHLWRDDPGGITQWAGWNIPCRRYNSWIVPTYHPSYVNRKEGSPEGQVVQLWFERHLESAIKKKGRPWKSIHNLESQVEIILDPDEAARRIRSFVEAGGASAFDYETNMIKPDHPKAEIVSCSICWQGKQTIAYPWVGEAVTATSEYLRSPHPKIGANTKFEDRWTRRILGHPVENWSWDDMLSSHHLDNRHGITSVKFQAFVRFGIEPWDLHIKPHLESTNNEGINRIRDLNMRDLLLYNGLDSLVEFRIAVDQMNEMLGR